MKFMLIKGSVNAVPINAIHIAVGSAPYSFTSGFEPTAKTEYMKAEITGPLAVVFSAFMYSVFAVGSKPLVKEYVALPTAIWVALIGTVFTLPFISMNCIT